MDEVNRSDDKTHTRTHFLLLELEYIATLLQGERKSQGERKRFDLLQANSS